MGKERVSNAHLERYLLNELPEARMREIETLAANDREIKRRLEELKRSNGDILEKYPAGLVAGRIRHLYENRKAKEEKDKKLEGERIGRNPLVMVRNFLFPIFALGAFVIAFIVFIPGRNYVDTGNINSSSSIYESTRLKGESRLYIYKKNNSGQELLSSGSTARKKDLLQLAYLSDGSAYGVILSIDGRGTVTLHYPAEERGSAKIESNKKIFLANSYELDDAPKFERFFFITSGSTIDVPGVVRSAKELARSSRDSLIKEDIPVSASLKESVKQYSVLIVKE